jgi:hypothetical protein
MVCGFHSKSSIGTAHGDLRKFFKKIYHSIAVPRRKKRSPEDAQKFLATAVRRH